MDREALYQKLPVAAQNLACSLEGWRIRRTRYGPGFAEALRLAEERDTWPAEKLVAFRDARLCAFVRHCADTVPYYQRLFRELGVRPEDIRSLEDLQALPVLTKQQVQEDAQGFHSEAVPASERITAHTSGTTGAGLRLATTLQAQQEQWAIWWRHWRRHGLTSGTWCGFFGGRPVVPLSQTRPPFWRCNRAGKQILFSGYHMSPTTMAAYVAELRRLRPPWLHGYPSLLALLANYVLESGQTLDYRPGWVTTGSENLLPHQADAMEQAFGVRPKQHYGLAEAVANFSECAHGMLHVDEDFAAVEFVPLPQEGTYRIVGTNLCNPAMPLVRYDTGDVVSLSGEECPCGRPGRVLQQVDGRQEDYIILHDGTRIGRVAFVFKEFTGIREAQLYQKVPGAFTIRIVRGPSYRDSDETRLLKKIRERVGEHTDVTVEYVSELERSRTGKLRFVVSEVREGHIAS